MNPINSPKDAPLEDVRMRGFARRTSVSDAVRWVDEHARPCDGERLPIRQSAGRVLCAPVVSPTDVPGFDRAMMDGYAVRACDTQGATPYNRLALEIIGSSMPAGPFDGHLGPGQAVRIMTGAPIPAGADAVVPAERTDPAGEHRVLVSAAIPAAKHIGSRGEDIRAGQPVLPAGRRLRPQDIGVLSSIGIGQIDVVRSPRVRVIITGDELLPAGSVPEGYQIVDANGPMLRALIQRDGGVVTDDRILRDQPEIIAAAMQDDADLILVSGGSSVGVEDHAPRLLQQLGHLAIHGIAIRPSSPTGMGTLGDRPVFLLPGNPVSCLCAYDFFAGRAVRRSAGRSPQWPYRIERLPLHRKIVSQIGRVDYARVRIENGAVEPLAISGASLLSSATTADGFVILDEGSEGRAAGDEVDVYLYDAFA